ncbi:Putative Leucine rich repeat domain-containing protein [Aspergillus calidoustus]|uniref:Putative Leucine rich repeat domain-containing protein n=1 Tax=Aspergillus calidoustus TaxID=454130 RepID=A0A0U5GS69_ASPCI|nr:Putative Leucine rich repeat domain-containing protein [Aspergillus calidoustus]
MMDTVPPSYQSATTRDAWAIIAEYIPSSDLCAATLVCRRWHRVFLPFLWGNPASHFGTENDEVYVALTRFRRTLKYARLEVRMLTHTLHMPPALSEIYGGPRPEWLREIFESLPCLQSLVVSELPFFDHSSMMALRGAVPSGASSRAYNIRLLVAEREPNTTSQGIAETLIRFPELIYLDLSYTTSAKDQTVLSALSQLERLQVLKLRGIGLRDIDAEFLANAIGQRVRYLDVRNNKFTDTAVRSLLRVCFLLPSHAASRQGPLSRTLPASAFLNQFPHQLPISKFLSSPMLDEEFRRALTTPLTGRSWVEDLPNAGITHLYIAENQITVDGVASLLATAQFHVLDVGTVETNAHVNRGTASQIPEQQAYPSAEQLIPILGTRAKEKLTYFRAHHSICTSTAPHERSQPPEDFLPELPAENRTEGFSELDTASTEIHELPADTNPVFELPGSAPVPQSPKKPDSHDKNKKPLIPRRGSIYAPEVLSEANDVTNSEDTALDPLKSRHVYSSSPILCSSPVSFEDSRARKIQELLAKRAKAQQPRRDGRESYIHYLHPFHVPNLEVLVLTDVPSHVPADSPILESLIQFITACSNEALLATLKAGTDYSLPPGQDRARAEQERAKSLFSLRRLVLEITPVTNSRLPLNPTAWKSVSSQLGHQKSTTGDWDLERLWSAASDDFSFFGETECGIPEFAQSRPFPIAALNETVTLTPDTDRNISEMAASFPTKLSLQSRTGLPANKSSHAPTSNRSFTPAAAPVVDLVAELASFRRRMKHQYEQTVRENYQRRSMSEALSPQSCYTAGPGSSTLSPIQRATSPAPGPVTSIAHHVEGHWKGEVKIVRNATPKGRTGMVDMYGNYFEKGYLYP